MKKFLFFITAFGISLFYSSCNRSWVCECKTNSGVVPIELNGVNKSEATASCEKYAINQYSATGGCMLK
ncbi:MAG: hypothetical protein JNM95_07715 [Chitinophagaceae bacterium]|nr:hypothetical protein [Chitinophagaceae bacterium]